MQKTNFKKNMTFNAAGNLLYLGSQWIVTVLVTRFASFSAAGILSIAMSLSAIFQTLALFGIRNFQISDVEEKYSDGTYFAFRHVCALASGVLAFLAALLLGYRGEVLLCAMLYMLFRIAESYSDVLHGNAQRRGRLDLAGIGFAIKGVLLLLGFLVGFLPAHSLLLGLLLMTAASVLTTLLFDFWVIRRRFPFSLRPRVRDWLPLAKESAPFCLYLFFYSCLSTLPKFVLEKLAGTDALGAYSSIFAPALLILAAAGYLYSPFAPTFATLRLQKKERDFRLLTGKITLVLLGALLLCLLCDALFGAWALSLLFGESILPYAYLLRPILLSVFAVALVAFFAMLVTVRRRRLLLCVGTGAGALSALALSPLFISLFDANGASYALCAASLIAVSVLAPAALFERKDLSS